MFLISISVVLAGVFLGAYLPYIPSTIVILVGSVGVGLAVLERYSSLTLRQGTLLFGALLFGLSWSLVSVQRPDIPWHMFPNQVSVDVVATVVEPVRHNQNRSVMVVSFHDINAGTWSGPVNWRIRVSWRQPDQEFGRGDRIRFRARLRVPSGNVNPGGFDYGAYLQRKDIQAVASVTGPGKIVLLESGRNTVRWYVWHVIDEWRDNIREAAVQTLQGPALGIYLGIIIGEQGYLLQETRDQFMASGTVHILSISGSHLGLIAFLSFLVVREACRGLPAVALLSLSRWIVPNRVAILVTLPLVTWYALLAGAEVATVRSLIMIMIFFVAVWLGRSQYLLHAVAVAALILVLFDPSAIWGISFQLSFVSVVAIALVLQWRGKRERGDVDRPPGWVEKLAEWVGDYAWITGGVVLATLPLVAYHFNQIAWLGLLANFLVVPFAGFVLVPLGLLTAVAFLIGGGDTLPLGGLNQVALDGMILLIKHLADIPGAEWHLASPSIIGIGLFMSFLVLAAYPGGKRWLRAGSLVAVMIMIGWWGWSPRQGVDGDTLRVTFMDVGQGDATLIEFPEGQTVLIDGGAKYRRLDMGRSVVGPLLWDRGIQKLDLVVGTHPQLDHVGGLPWIFDHFDVDEYWGNGIRRPRVFYRRLQTSLRVKGLTEKHARQGQVLLNTRSCQLEVVHPQEGNVSPTPEGRTVQSGTRLNNLSVVTRLECGPHSFLFTGDIETEALQQLAEGRAKVKARIVKVPHHGAGTSFHKKWLKKIEAEHAIISVGRQNPYRHPAPSVVQGYQDQGIALLRTDRDGAITVTAHVSTGDLTITTARGVQLRPIHPQQSMWGQEIINLRRIWNQIKNS